MDRGGYCSFTNPTVFVEIQGSLPKKAAPMTATEMVEEALAAAIRARIRSAAGGRRRAASRSNGRDPATAGEGRHGKTTPAPSAREGGPQGLQRRAQREVVRTSSSMTPARDVRRFVPAPPQARRAPPLRYRRQTRASRCGPIAGRGIATHRRGQSTVSKTPILDAVRETRVSIAPKGRDLVRYGIAKALAPEPGEAEIYADAALGREVSRRAHQQGECSRPADQHRRGRCHVGPCQCPDGIF